MKEFTIANMTSIEMLVDLIDETSECVGDNYNISQKCDDIIEEMIHSINDLNNPTLKGKYFFTESNLQYCANEAITNDVDQLGVHIDHDGVWEFNGRIHDDVYSWVENIMVFFYHADGSGFDYIIGHHKHGLIFSNETVFGRFIKRFPTNVWDYRDI